MYFAQLTFIFLLLGRLPVQHLRRRPLLRVRLRVRGLSGAPTRIVRPRVRLRRPEGRLGVPVQDGLPIRAVRGDVRGEVPATRVQVRRANDKK